MKTIMKMIAASLVLMTLSYADQTTTVSNTATNTQDLINIINNHVNQVITSKNIPGFHLSVIQNGQIILNQGYGYTNISTKQPVSNETIYGLASITKTFTALALLKLVETGAINLDAPLDDYISDLTPAYQNITIRQLASMTAGIPKGVKSAANVSWPAQMQILIQQPLVSTPGEKYLYSNFSYRLIGQVIENVTSKSYLDFIQETILSPLNMNSTSTLSELQSTGLVASPYAGNQGVISLTNTSYRDPQVEFAAGMLASNGNDLIKYVLALLNNQILSPSSYQTLWYDRPALPDGTPANWAFGWGSRIDSEGKRIISMNGADPGVASSIIMVPQTKCAVIGLSNVRKPAVYNLSRWVAHLACGVQPRNASVPQAVEQIISHLNINKKNGPHQ